MSKFKNEFELRELVINNFVNNIEDVINYDNDKDEDEIYTELEDSVMEILDDMLIYYHTQFDVVNVLRNINDFNDNELGLEINSIGQLAFAMLYEFVMDRDLVGHAMDKFNDKE